MTMRAPQPSADFQNRIQNIQTVLMRKMNIHQQNIRAVIIKTLQDVLIRFEREDIEAFQSSIRFAAD